MSVLFSVFLLYSSNKCFFCLFFLVFLVSTVPDQIRRSQIANKWRYLESLKSFLTPQVCLNSWSTYLCSVAVRVPLKAQKTGKCYSHSSKTCRIYYYAFGWLLTAQTCKVKSSRLRMASCLSVLQLCAATECCWMSHLSLCYFDRCCHWCLSVSFLSPICFLT